MTVWALGNVAFLVKCFERTGFNDAAATSTLLQLLYIAKFFWWENGYMRTIDIMVDRAGFYICWGCLVWIPSLYLLPSFYMATHADNLGIEVF